MKTIEPFHNQVLFRRLDPDMSAGGLHVPAAVESSVRCIVISRGPGLLLPGTGERAPMTDLKEGDEILVKPSAQVSVVAQTGETLYMVPESDIIGRVLGGHSKLHSKLELV